LKNCQQKLKLDGFKTHGKCSWENEDFRCQNVGKFAPVESTQQQPFDWLKTMICADMCSADYFDACLFYHRALLDRKFSMEHGFPFTSGEKETMRSSLHFCKNQ